MFEFQTETKYVAVFTLGQILIICMGILGIMSVYLSKYYTN